MSDANKAVFLSYAREDGDAARRIAQALRSFGLAVWFDQNELRGGEAWDAKLRTQIRTCTLFMPVISATTQARSEATFAASGNSRLSARTTWRRESRLSCPW